MVPVAQWLERLTVDEEVEGSTPFRHPTKNFHTPFPGVFCFIQRCKDATLTSVEARFDVDPAI